MADEVNNTSDNDADANELRVFVSETLSAVMAGVGDVRTSASIVSPKGNGRYVFKAPTEIEFDIAVTAKRSAQAGGKLKLQVFSVGLNGGGESHSETSTVSRIRFSVPRAYLENGRDE
ncbi:trypco2 family protein [Sphingobium sp. CFD-1]|uniref:trypco2 family protein n=1 Tax=Sphingobium sp. CFD-1 TaxID=2878545 RepID=UPI00214BCAFB|nr:trypco2 family protein [Sphingobium sp. CFD-1]